MTTLALRDEFRRNPALPMLIGDATFIRGIREGVERGDYVYQRGDLLFGPGDPAATVMIDEQAVVLTMDYAKNKGVWPRPPVTEPNPLPAPDPDPPPPDPEPPGTKFTAEGVLREALVQLWEQVRGQNVERVARLRIRLLDAGDAFPLLSAVSRIPGAEKMVALKGGYETRDGGTCELEFEGPAPEAQPVRDFLRPQLLAAVSTSLDARITLIFRDGLAMHDQAPEQLADELCRYASGAAIVSATASP